jgi:hypothetical protein
MNSYLLAVSGVTHALCACNQSEFDAMVVVVAVVKFFFIAPRQPHRRTKTEDIGCENHPTSDYLTCNQALTLILHYQSKWCS